MAWDASCLCVLPKTVSFNCFFGDDSLPPVDG